MQYINRDLGRHRLKEGHSKAMWGTDFRSYDKIII